jgi:hypothetical protein
MRVGTRTDIYSLRARHVDLPGHRVSNESVGATFDTSASEVEVILCK